MKVIEQGKNPKECANEGNDNLLITQKQYKSLFSELDKKKKQLEAVESLIAESYIEDGMKLVKFDTSESSLKLKYLYLKLNGDALAKKVEMYEMHRLLTKKEPIKKENLNEYEYFCLLVRESIGEEQNSQHENAGQYYLVSNGIPVTKVRIIQESTDTVEVRVATAPRYRHRGFATIALQMTEEFIFNSSDIQRIHLIDITEERATSAIALKLGYTMINSMEFYKMKEKRNISTNHQ